jgi:hypothetical protein
LRASARAEPAWRARRDRPGQEAQTEPRAHELLSAASLAAGLPCIDGRAREKVLLSCADLSQDGLFEAFGASNLREICEHVEPPIPLSDLASVLDCIERAVSCRVSP